MSIRTIFEINHDFAHLIDQKPDEFIRLLGNYLRSAEQDAADDLRLGFGVRRVWWGLHSDERRIVTAHDDVKL